ncbi:4-(cytidine 5'-diphospho)-2-C-methyl-D-erythritol kinase [Sulfurimonas sp.]|nr:4-(cytidine 5'-diphospho)-2-C-methyl-D-erythritol kinase [Sulfurimonas sp.]
MGGFEGGDEGGFWDEDAIKTLIDKPNNPTKEKSFIESDGSIYSIKAHAKVNIFLKITGHKDGFHTLLSRFMRVDNLYDTISFVPANCKEFSIEGCDDIPLKSNTIYKAYKALCDYTNDSDIEEFFLTHKVVVTKEIPSQAGLGGGSSDASAFMLLAKEVCNLVISTDELSKVGSTIGSDLPFFIHNYPSANVSGFGEIVEAFEEEALHIELYKPDIGCDTTLVYKTFKQHLLADIDLSSFEGWEKLDSKSILEMSDDPALLNDLYAASLIAYPELKEEAKKGWFFSGSGSTFFTIKN